MSDGIRPYDELRARTSSQIENVAQEPLGDQAAQIRALFIAPDTPDSHGAFGA